MLRAPHARKIAPSTTTRCKLELGPWLSVPVFAFKATEEAKVPSFKLYSEQGKVKAITEYRRPADLTSGGSAMAPEERMRGAWRALQAVPRQRVNVSALTARAAAAVSHVPRAAYRYGKDLVSMNPSEEAGSKVRALRAARSDRACICNRAARTRAQFKPGPRREGTGDDAFFKGMQLVGFASAASLPQHLSLKRAEYILPWPPKSHPSGLWRSGGEKETDAARCVSASSLRRTALPHPRWLTHILCTQRRGGYLRDGARAGGELLRGARAHRAARACPAPAAPLLRCCASI
jgi:hypothetical protein